MSSYILMTGASGLVGRYLVRDLLAAGQRLALILRSSKRESYSDRLESICQQWETDNGRPLPRPVVFEGDISEPFLGLSEAAQTWVAGNCNRMLHNAAILQFDADEPGTQNGEPWKTNVGGTRYMLDLCKKVGLRDLHYVSTAYVCGFRDAPAMEDELDVGQTFRNAYEESKFLAEKMVREADFIDNLTVYRPAVIAGDSKTGYTLTYHGLYMYLKLMSVLLRNETPGPDGRIHAAVRLNMTGEENRNLIPVDWVSEVIAKLMLRPEAQGKTFHLAPVQGLKSGAVIKWGFEYFNAYGVTFNPANAPSDERISKLDADAHENMTTYTAYETTDPTFDVTNLHKFAGDIPLPEIDEAMLHSFIKYGEEDRWGKRRAPKIKVDAWVAPWLKDRLGPPAEPLASSVDLSASGVQTVGLDLVGPGGGQWKLDVQDGRIGRYDLGLPESAPTVSLPASEFLALAAGSSEAAVAALRTAAPSLSETAAEAVVQSLFTQPRAADSVVAPSGD